MIDHDSPILLTTVPFLPERLEVVSSGKFADSWLKYETSRCFSIRFFLGPCLWNTEFRHRPGSMSSSVVAFVDCRLAVSPRFLFLTQRVFRRRFEVARSDRCLHRKLFARCSFIPQLGRWPYFYRSLRFDA